MDATQMNEKQKVKFIYGILEKQFHSYYEAAVAADDYRRACGAIRKIIAWDMIYALA